MKRPYHLNTQFVRYVRKPGFYGDGRGGSGLTLRVHRTASGDLSKSWAQRVIINGKRTMIGHGSYPFVDLAEARRRAVIAKGKTLQGIDPRTDEPVLHFAPEPKPKREPNGLTFDEAAEATIRLHGKQWKEGSTTEAYWRRSLLGLPFGRKLVSDVSSSDVLKAVRPIWNKTPRKAADTLRFISKVLDWSIGHEHRRDANPTKAVRAALPKQNRKPKHYAALPPAEIPAAMRKLETCQKSRSPIIRLLIRFCWLTATRPGEAASATWKDIDRRGKRWTIPTTKNGKPFVVPLSDAALDVLHEAARVNRTGSVLVFPNRNGKRISGKTMKSCLALCGIENATVHGTGRSGFRVWAAEHGLDRYVSEMCLNHDIGNAVEQAYQRSDLYEQRAEIMQRWSEYLTG